MHMSLEKSARANYIKLAFIHDYSSPPKEGFQ
jgi:hypothetical protein